MTVAKVVLPQLLLRLTLQKNAASLLSPHSACISVVFIGVVQKYVFVYRKIARNDVSGC
jgi:hypothetical protein